MDALTRVVDISIQALFATTVRKPKPTTVWDEDDMMSIVDEDSGSHGDEGVVADSTEDAEGVNLDDGGSSASSGSGSDSGESDIDASGDMGYDSDSDASGSFDKDEEDDEDEEDDVDPHYDAFVEAMDAFDEASIANEQDPLDAEAEASAKARAKALAMVRVMSATMRLNDSMYDDGGDSDGVGHERKILACAVKLCWYQAKTGEDEAQSLATLHTATEVCNIIIDACGDGSDLQFEPWIEALDVDVLLFYREQAAGCRAAAVTIDDDTEAGSL